MNFQLQTFNVLLDVVPIANVCSAFARASATGCGTTPFHQVQYDAYYKAITARLLRDIETGQLVVCSQKGDPLSPNVLIELAAIHPMLCVDVVLNKLLHCYTRIHYLNQWGASHGDSFSLNHEGLPWVDERGRSDAPDAEERKSRLERINANGPWSKEECGLWEKMEPMLKARERKVEEKAAIEKAGEVKELSPISMGWQPIKPRRYQGYTRPLYDLLKTAHVMGLPCLKPRDVLDAFRSKQPPEVNEVMLDELKYYDGNGNIKCANIKAMRQAITRMTTIKA